MIWIFQHMRLMFSKCFFLYKSLQTFILPCNETKGKSGKTENITKLRYFSHFVVWYEIVERSSIMFPKRQKMFLFGDKLLLSYGSASSGLKRKCSSIKVTTQTRKPGKLRRLFPVRENWNFAKVREIFEDVLGSLCFFQVDSNVKRVDCKALHARGRPHVQ